MLPSDVLSLSQLWKSWLLPRVKFKHLLHEKLFECGLTLDGWFERLNNFRFTCLLFVCSACSVSGPSLEIRSIRRQSPLLLPLSPETRILPRKQLLLSDQFGLVCRSQFCTLFPCAEKRKPYFSEGLNLKGEEKQLEDTTKYNKEAYHNLFNQDALS